jgi:hypothetical protein
VKLTKTILEMMENTTKEIRAQTTFHIVHKSNESFNMIREKLEQALNCKFQFEKYRLEYTDVAHCLGLVLLFSSCNASSGNFLYSLWGEKDMKIMESEYSPYKNVDEYEWQYIDFSYSLITTLQAANCGIWRKPTKQDYDDIASHENFYYPDGHT